MQNTELKNEALIGGSELNAGLGDTRRCEWCREIARGKCGCDAEIEIERLRAVVVELKSEQQKLSNRKAFLEYKRLHSDQAKTIARLEERITCTCGMAEQRGLRLAELEAQIKVYREALLHIKWMKDCGIDSSQGNHPGDERDAMYKIATKALAMAALKLNVGLGWEIYSEDNLPPVGVDVILKLHDGSTRMDKLISGAWQPDDGIIYLESREDFDDIALWKMNQRVR